MTQEREPQPIEVVLVDYPSELKAADPTRGRPLGPYVEVGTRIMTLLPGAVFDAHGEGTYTRATYQLSFRVSTEAPTAVHVSIDHVEGLRAIGRLAAGTGWRVTDPRTATFVDVDASLAAGHIVPFSVRLTAWERGAAPAPPPRRSWSSISALAFVVLVVAIGLPAAWGVANWPSLMGEIRRLALSKTTTPTEVALAERSTLLDLHDAAAAEQAFAIMTGVPPRYAPVEALADPKPFAPINMAPLLRGLFASADRHGYTFEFIGEGKTVLEGPLQPIGPVYASFIYVARPQLMTPGGRTFAVFPDGRIFATTAQRTPTRQDQEVPVEQP